ncbi:MAG TPA: O-antigen ligase family protein [Bryobacteraceae bacterium]|nr:O-antigen ligase family protein [Bryobacteraceae bacterium]
MTNYLPLALYLLFFGMAVFAPHRWAIIGYLLLSNIDLGTHNASIGALNTAKAMILPVYLLWRFRAWGGHGKLTPAPVIWILLTSYVAIASLWTLYPAYALKLIAHLLGSLLIAMMLLRASKGGYITVRTIVIVAVGTLGIALAHWFLAHNWGGEPDRFSTFADAQSFAAFVTALYCAIITSRTLSLVLRTALAAALVFSVLLNGSRTWLIGLLVSSLLAIFVSQVRSWVKLLSFVLTLMFGTLLIAEFSVVMNWVAQMSGSNRIARAVSDAYRGNYKATGLGTFKLRETLFHRTVAGIASGTPAELIFGHGTCNGAQIAATISKNPDPNRALHDEWLRALYEWGIVGLLLWLGFIGSLVHYSLRAIRGGGDYAQPLFTYLPAFAIGLSGENIIASAGNAVSLGLLMLIALASISYRAGERMALIRAHRESGFGPAAGRFEPAFRGSQ